MAPSYSCTSSSPSGAPELPPAGQSTCVMSHPQVMSRDNLLRAQLLIMCPNRPLQLCRNMAPRNLAVLLLAEAVLLDVKRAGVALGNKGRPGLRMDH